MICGDFVRSFVRFPVNLFVSEGQNMFKYHDVFSYHDHGYSVDHDPHFTESFWSFLVFFSSYFVQIQGNMVENQMANSCFPFALSRPNHLDHLPRPTSPFAVLVCVV